MAGFENYKKRLYSLGMGDFYSIRLDNTLHLSNDVFDSEGDEFIFQLESKFRMIMGCHGCQLRFFCLHCKFK
jgi:hypothetical protein